MSARDELAEVMKPAAAYDYWPQAAADRVIAAGWVSPDDVARIRAEAWDEGHMDGYWDAEHEQMIQRGVRRRTDNPYRAAAVTEGPGE